MSINCEDFASSDSSDEDFIPGEVSDVSCESSDEDKDKKSTNSESVENSKNSSQSRKRKKKSVDSSIRKRKGGIKLEDEEDNSDNDKEEKSDNKDDEEAMESDKIKNDEIIENKEKSRVDALWSDFLKDVEPPVGKKTPASKDEKSSEIFPKSSSLNETKQSSPKEEKVKVTKIFDFAGEQVSVTKEVSSSSKEAKEAAKEEAKETNQVIPKRPPVKKASGVAGLLKKLDKKPKISVLDKSKLDWNSFKDDEGIEDELDQYKKGKDGYLEKQDFLQRTDFRQFEIEKSFRMKQRSQRK